MTQDKFYARRVEGEFGLKGKMIYYGNKEIKLISWNSKQNADKICEMLNAGLNAVHKTKTTQS